MSAVDRVARRTAADRLRWLAERAKEGWGAQAGVAKQEVVKLAVEKAGAAEQLRSEY